MSTDFKLTFDLTIPVEWVKALHGESLTSKLVTCLAGPQKQSKPMISEDSKQLWTDIIKKILVTKDEETETVEEKTTEEEEEEIPTSDFFSKGGEPAVNLSGFIGEFEKNKSQITKMLSEIAPIFGVDTNKANNNLQNMFNSLSEFTGSPRKTEEIKVEVHTE
jgi:hypothetical protein